MKAQSKIPEVKVINQRIGFVPPGLIRGKSGVVRVPTS